MSAKKYPELFKIIRFLENETGYGFNELLAKNRTMKTSAVRQVLYYLSVETRTYSSTELGSFYRRDHATILHGHKAIKEILRMNTSYMLDQYVKKLVEKYTIITMPQIPFEHTEEYIQRPYMQDNKELNFELI